jgi:8-oxo-dGTP diphosphatase
MDKMVNHNRNLTIDAIIFVNNKILLIKRKNEPFQNYWALPGGYIERDEEVSERVKKEVFEETSLSVTSMKLLNIYSKPKRDPKQNISLVYIVETVGTAQAGDDAEEARWFVLKKLPEKLAFDHRQIIDDYINSYL